MQTKIIDVQAGKGADVLLYPDSQPHVTLKGIGPDDDVHVIHPMRSALDVMRLASIGNALKHATAGSKHLTIPYLLGARSDRVMKPGDSVELEVMADIINNCRFNTVRIFDVHSPRALELIQRSSNVDNRVLVQGYGQENAVLIVPDKGAVHKSHAYRGWNPNITDTVYCDKARDLSNGAITLKVLDPDKCTDRNCVIIDDLCDGGGTFLAIAEQIKPKHLTLIVTHGIFSKGFPALLRSFQEIITTNSFWTYTAPPQVRIIDTDTFLN
jgi:ribose-phosphate pyrophosphokinase